MYSCTHILDTQESQQHIHSTTSSTTHTHIYTYEDPNLDIANAKLADFGLMVLAAKQTQLARNELKLATLPEKQVSTLSMLTTSAVEGKADRKADREADRKAAKRAQKEELVDGLADQLYVCYLRMCVCVFYLFGKNCVGTGCMHANSVCHQCVPFHQHNHHLFTNRTRLSMAPMRSASLFGVAQLRVGSKLVGLKGMLGSVPYIAPEIVKKKPYNEKVYCTWCCMRLVFGGQTLHRNALHTNIGLRVGLMCGSYVYHTAFLSAPHPHTD